MAFPRESATSGCEVGLKRVVFFLVVAGIIFGAVTSAPAVAAQSSTVAIVGATLIDGNGGPPVADAVVVIDGSRITAAGPRASVAVPRARA